MRDSNQTYSRHDCEVENSGDPDKNDTTLNQLLPSGVIQRLVGRFEGVKTAIWRVEVVLGHIERATDEMMADARHGRRVMRSVQKR